MVSIGYGGKENTRMYANVYVKKPQAYQGNMGKFGDVVKQEREKQGWTQEELAVKAGSTKASISRYESGVQLPKNDTALRIADALYLDARGTLELLIEDALAQAPEGQNTSESINEILRIHDSQEREVVKYLRGMPPEIRDRAVIAVKNWKDAGDMVRAERERNTLGKAADRHENPTVREDSERGRKVARAESKQRQEEETKTAEQELFWKEDPDGALAQWMQQNGESTEEKDKDHAVDGDAKRDNGN